MIIIKYQWLLEYQQLQEEIDLLKWKIRKSELELERWMDPGDLGNLKLSSESKSAKLEKNIERDKAYLNEKELSMEALMIMVNRFKGIDNKVLKMKYIDGLTLECIAEELNYSSSHIYKKHAELVKTIKFIESMN